MSMPTDIPPVGAPSPAAYITPKRPKQERRRQDGDKHPPDPPKEPDDHDGLDCYT
jgi:hypothetical protein